jgi:homogentisate 1,2-dioxygenase
MHTPFQRMDNGRITSDFGAEVAPPNQLRWNPLPLPDAPVDFVQGLVTMAGNGDPNAQPAPACHLYAANRSMRGRSFYNADGEMLIVPQTGKHRFVTELGVIEAEPQEIVVIPRGLRFRLELPDGRVRGYVCENFGANFKLPDLGPIGSNGLANPRDFLTPVAAYEDVDGPHELVGKFMGQLWSARMDHSPMDVVAWHGNYAPYKYDLRRFNAIGSISFDHPDPSIFLVLHSASDTAGVQQHRLRDLPAAHPGDAGHLPAALVPSQHRERIHGPGARGLRRQGRGLRARRRQPAQQHERPRPRRRDLREGQHRRHLAAARDPDTMAFMFETRCVLRPTRHALQSAQLQDDYFRCWQGLRKHFDPKKP